MHCARSAGTFEWTEDSPTPSIGGGVLPVGDQRSRCPHCAGPVYVEEVVRVRVDPVVVFEKPRRGRPRKHPLPEAAEGFAQAS